MATASECDETLTEALQLLTMFTSKVCVHYTGLALAEGRTHEEDIIYAEIEPTEARKKYEVVIPGELEVHFVNDRRPEFYDEITQPLADSSRIRS
jgi:hypothetical protein